MKRILTHIFNLVSGKYTGAALTTNVEQRAKIDEIEATLNGEGGWMLEKKRDGNPVRFECACKEVK